MAREETPLVEESPVTQNKQKLDQMVTEMLPSLDSDWWGFCASLLGTVYKPARFRFEGAVVIKEIMNKHAYHSYYIFVERTWTNGILAVEP